MTNDFLHTSQQASTEERRIWEILEGVPDPEVPVLTIVDLGIVRAVRIAGEQGLLEIDITPTYSGCPAMDMIAINIRMMLLQHGFKQIKINMVLSPAWTTDWMSTAGKRKLLAYGIAPPVGKALDHTYLENLKVECPQCRSYDTRLLSQFGSTSCKALFYCNNCNETFDYFKCH